MKNYRPYLKAKSIFLITIITVIVTFLVVYLSGLPFSRSITTNTIISLSVIALIMFAFLVYGLYSGRVIKNDYKGPGEYRMGHIFNNLHESGPLEGYGFKLDDGGEGCTGLIVSVLLWIAVGILFVVGLLLLEAILWLSLLLLFSMLYWGFLRGLRMIFRHAEHTQGNLPASVAHAFYYTFLYVGWMIGIVYVVGLVR